MARCLFTCMLVLLVSASSNLVSARGMRTAADVQRLSVLSEARSAWGKFSHSLSRGVLVVGTSLLLVCSQMGLWR